MTKPTFDITYKAIERIDVVAKELRKHPKTQVQKLAKIINKYGFLVPIVIDTDNKIISGNGRYLAAKSLGLETVPTIQVSHLSDEEKRAFAIADNKIAESSEWNIPNLTLEIKDLLSIDTLELEPDLLGFSSIEIDNLLFTPLVDEEQKSEEKDDDSLLNLKIEKRVKPGDLWQLGKHRLFCGDSLEVNSYQTLLNQEKAATVVTDSPYNLKIANNVTTKQHSEFKMASGEMTEQEFSTFLKNIFDKLVQFSKDGSIHFHFMDWRHVLEMNMAGLSAYTELKNICVWDKGTGGMGSLYRSQHEFCFVFKNGSAKYTNNIELGKHGRYRTNVWAYKGMHAQNKQCKDLTKLHPTVKPIPMLMDCLMDCSNLNEIVLDCFGGSGSTLIAAERTKRRARLIEISPDYCDIIIARWEKETGKKAHRLQDGGSNDGRI